MVYRGHVIDWFICMLLLRTIPRNAPVGIVQVHKQVRVQVLAVIKTCTLQLLGLFRVQPAYNV